MTLSKGKCWTKLLGVGRIDVLHEVMQGRDYGQFKDYISIKIKMETAQQVRMHVKTCWKQQKTKENEPSIDDPVRCRIELATTDLLINVVVKAHNLRILIRSIGEVAPVNYCR